MIEYLTLHLSKTIKIILLNLYLTYDEYKHHAEDYQILTSFGTQLQ